MKNAKLDINLHYSVIPACIWQESSLAHCGFSGFPLKNLAGMTDLSGLLNFAFCNLKFAFCIEV
jgi:hypothetical protein